METFCLGNPDAKRVLIQPVDEHDLEFLESEFNLIKTMTGTDFYLVVVKVVSWNKELSPWKAPAVFGREDFGDGAGDFLKALLPMCSDREKTYYIGGYSLAGLFALWAAYQTDTFSGVAAASPSMWFPDFTEYMQKNSIRCDVVYLSLGDKEAKARNPVMATVEDRMADACKILESAGTKVTFEWNPGNHFREADLRTAKAFARLLNEDKNDTINVK